MSKPRKRFETGTTEPIQKPSGSDKNLPEPETLKTKCLYFLSMFLPPIIFHILLQYSHDLILSSVALLIVHCLVIMLSIKESKDDYDSPASQELYWLDYLESELQKPNIKTKAISHGIFWIMAYSLIPYFLFKWTQFPDFDMWYFPFGNLYVHYPKISVIIMLYYVIGAFCIQNGVAQTIMYYAVIHVCKFRTNLLVGLVGALCQTLMTGSLWYSFSRSWDFVFWVMLVSFVMHLYRYYLLAKEGFVIALVNMVCFNAGQVLFCILIFWRLENLDSTKTVVMDPENVWTKLFSW